MLSKRTAKKAKNWNDIFYDFSYKFSFDRQCFVRQLNLVNGYRKLFTTNTSSWVLELICLLSFCKQKKLIITILKSIYDLVDDIILDYFLRWCFVYTWNVCLIWLFFKTNRQTIRFWLSDSYCYEYIHFFEIPTKRPWRLWRVVTTYNWKSGNWSMFVLVHLLSDL